MKIVADDKIPYLRGILEPFASVTYLPGLQILRNDLLDTDALLTRSVTNCNAELLRGTNVKFIASATIGEDHIDTEFCRAEGIKWITSKGCNSNAVVQYVFSALFALSEKYELDLTQKTLGVVGVGSIGSKIEKTARSLGMKVMLNDPPRARTEENSGFVPLQSIATDADIVTIHVPLTISGEDKTLKLIGSEFFNHLKKPVILINTARGQVIDHFELKKAIRSGNVALSVIDVWEDEPLIDPVLHNLATIATPHIAGYSIEGKANATAMIVNALSKFYHFDLDVWFPDLHLEETNYSVNGKGLNDQEILQQVIKRAYDIWKDDRLLRENNNFETLRREYIFRPENKNFRIKGENLDESVIRKLNSLGFKTT